MIKKLSKHGNSLALVIDKAILELLNIDADTPLEVTTDGQRLIVLPTRANEDWTAFERAMHQSIEAYSPMYKRLAE